MEIDPKFKGVRGLLQESFEKFTNSNVCLVGLGGVGSWTAEALVRSGLKNLTLIDLDEICVTNINRQVHATSETVGQMKVKAIQERCQKINSFAEICTIEDFLTEETVSTLISNHFDLVIDAIDSVENKAILIDYCLKEKIKIITSGAAGGRIDPTKILVSDLGKTQNDELLFALKKKMKRKFNYPSGEVVFGVSAIHSREKVHQNFKELVKSGKLDCSGSLGSAAHLTGSLGFALAAEAMRILSHAD